VSDLIVEHGEMSGRRRLHDLLPSDAILRDLTLEAQAEGFRMEDYTVPPGTLPAAQFATHMIGVGEAVHGPCSMSWCGRDGINTRPLSRGLIFISSPGPVDIVYWDGEIRMLSLSIESATMEAVLPEPFTRRPVELLTIRAGASDPVLNHLLHVIKSEGENRYVGGRLFMESLCHTTAIYLAQR
jgi:hypothetical protein